MKMRERGGMGMRNGLCVCVWACVRLELSVWLFVGVHSKVSKWVLSMIYDYHVIICYYVCKGWGRCGGGRKDMTETLNGHNGRNQHTHTRVWWLVWRFHGCLSGVMWNVCDCMMCDVMCVCVYVCLCVCVCVCLRWVCVDIRTQVCCSWLIASWCGVWLICVTGWMS